MLALRRGAQPPGRPSGRSVPPPGPLLVAVGRVVGHALVLDHRLPPELRGLVERMLDPDPAMRPDAGRVAAELQRPAKPKPKPEPGPEPKPEPKPKPKPAAPVGDRPRLVTTIKGPKGPPPSPPAPELRIGRGFKRHPKTGGTDE